MAEKVEPNAPAFPTQDTIHPATGERFEPLNTGLSKREYIATMALQGLLANSNYKLVFNPKEVLESCVSDAVLASDLLLTELSK